MENKIEIIFTDEGISVKPIGEINSLRAIQGMFALVGKTLCVSEWARELNISPYTIYHWANKGADYAVLKLEERFLTKLKGGANGK